MDGLDILVFFGNQSALASSVGGLKMFVLGAPGHGRGPAFPKIISFVERSLILPIRREIREVPSHSPPFSGQVERPGGLP